MASRRAVLITGCAAVAVAGGALAPLLHSDLRQARAPWRTAGERFGDARLDALSYAVLAPSPHNMQPWLARLDGDDRLTLYSDLTRRLPETDPPNRQIVIGLGAFLELLRQSAAEAGFALDIDPFPEGEPWPVLDERPAAAVRFVADADAPKDPLFSTIPARRTSRAAFDRDRPVADATLNTLDEVLRAEDGEFEWVNDAANVDALKTLCREAWEIELTNAATHQESTRLTRIGEREINQQPDGISLHGPVMEGLRLAGVMTREKMKDPASRAFAGSLDFYNGLIDSAMAFGWLSTAGNSRTDQLRAGAGWVRLNQAAALHGLAMQPLSQPLQEFPAMREKFEEIHDFIGMRPPAGAQDARIQGLFRFGYAKAPPPSPRWPLRSRLIAADA